MPTSSSVALVHSGFCQVNFHGRIPNDNVEDVFSLTSCSALRGFRGIQILGSAPDGRGRGNRDGLGKSHRSPCHLFRHVLRARLLRDLFRSYGSTSQSLG